MLTDGFCVYAQFDGRVKQAGTVEVTLQALFGHQVGILLQVVKRQDLARLGIFQAHQAGSGKMKVIGLDGLPDFLQIQLATEIEWQGLRLDATQYGAATAFIFVGVGPAGRRYTHRRAGND